MPSLEDLPPLPRTVLLRCEEYVPVSDTSVPNAVSRVDVHRESAKLGWEQYNRDFISTVLKIPGTHFNIFNEEYVRLFSSFLAPEAIFCYAADSNNFIQLDNLTTQVKLACNILLAAGR